jgi:hypothetical protein
VPTKKAAAAHPTDMTATGTPPSAPPGQTRLPGHAVPSVDREPGRQTLPAGALQTVQLAAPSAEKVPKPQSAQAEAVVAPLAAENLPASQLEQVATSVAPTTAENLPAVHLVQKVDPAIYIHTLSHTTLYMFLHLYVSR